MSRVQAPDALAVFHPLVAEWFEGRVGSPTPVQEAAWPSIAAGEHALVTAPTGSGKTLTAFLWAIDRLLTGGWEGGGVRVLYVSPLRALNNDIQRNLLSPLAELEELFGARGREAFPVRVATRSGDTPNAERRRMLRQPPEILITTPESLNILLTSKGGRSLLTGLRCVVLDEIHAVAAGKRGVHLMTAIERLVPLSGEVQRVALSATIRPLERIARFVGGWELDGASGEAAYRRREVKIVQAGGPKVYDLAVSAPSRLAIAPGLSDDPGQAARGGDEANLWDELTAKFKRRIRRNRSTLVFANSRRKAEKVTRLLNVEEAEELVYSHHGSLSREIRAVVEGRLKEGRLAGIVATNSLELGIDIGALDEVLLVQTPPTIASTVQRIGRAGHGVGEVSRARLYPFYGRDLIDAAVVAESVVAGEIEEVEPIAAPLDVLAQVILSMVAAERWDVDELYDFLRCCESYRDLGRRQYDLVLEMLAGRYADSRIRELHPRLSIDRLANTVAARPGAARLVYMSGGTIPDRGYFHLRLQETMAKIGELDEEFVWERSLGDTFVLGAQNWRIQRVTHNDVLVTPAGRSSAMAPFWRAEERNRSFFLSRRIGGFLEAAELSLDADPSGAELGERLRERHLLDDGAAERLVELLRLQRAATGGALPHRGHLLIERVASAETGPDREQVLLHTGWGGRVNRPLAIAIAAGWEERYPHPLPIECDNDCLMVELPRGFDVDELFELARPDNIEALLRKRLQKSGFFGARFREGAGRALLLPRAGFRRRVPLWLNRQRAKKLMESVSSYGDFPILVETWRTCLEDEFDLEALARVLDELASGEIRTSEVSTATPSPLAAGIVWKQTNRLMYEDDVPEAGSGPGVRSDLLKELVFSSQLRPRLSEGLIARFTAKLQRTFPGYAPRTADELVEWVRERLVIPAAEWAELVEAVGRDLEGFGGDVSDLLDGVSERVVRARFGRGREVVCALESLPRLSAALDMVWRDARLSDLEDPSRPPRPAVTEALKRLAAQPPRSESEPPAARLATLVAEWLRCYGPLKEAHLSDAFGLDGATTQALLGTLVEGEAVVVDRFRPGDGAPLELCDAENLERLLRIQRAERRPTVEAQPLERLPLFLAARQGLTRATAGVETLQSALERLFGFPAPAEAWESELFPSRLDPYYPAWLDSVMQESDLAWLGCGREKLTFGFLAERDLFSAEGALDAAEEAAGPAEREALTEALSGGARLGLSELGEATELGSGRLADLLWESAWEGAVSNTTFLAVRQGILNRFQPAAAVPSPSRRRTTRRRGFERWRSSRPFAGDWFSVGPAETGPGAELDALDREELNKERVWLLLDRYGVLFRELLARELPAFAWSRLFRSLRLMELSGEIVSGHFFAGVPGIQFASRAALAELLRGLPEDAIYWMSAIDPAAPCGLGLEAFKGRVPRRVPSNHLVFHGDRLVVRSQRNGSELEIEVAADHPHLDDYLRFLRTLLTRQFRPLKAVRVEAINGEPAASSPYAAPLAEPFAATREAGALSLRRRY